MKNFLPLFFLSVTIPFVHAFPSLDLNSGEKQVSLLELYTSEGCSSCPPAESWFSTLKSSPDLWKKFVPISFHVDYWNNLGWPDPYSAESYTQRQHLYAEEWHSESIYTPEFVLNGKEARPMQGESLQAFSHQSSGRLKATLHDDGKLECSFLPQSPVTGRLIVEVALLGNNVTSLVTRGENSGRTLHHDFLTLALVKGILEAPKNSTSKEYTGSLTIPLDLKAPASAIALWVRSEQSLTPLQATGGWLK